MNVILLERVDKLGQIGDLVTVKSGYARNFLLPKGKAVFASKENIKIFEDKKNQLEGDNIKRKKEAESLAKNISFSSDKESDNLDKVKMSINKANLDSFIKNSENGLDSNIGERGSRISGGEKQRIGIARALYNNPDILIFDESTSSLDKQTENKIIQEIFENNKEKTIIFVSHNLDNLKNCEKIFELKDKNLLIKK